jgi:hypothetical protein
MDWVCLFGAPAVCCLLLNTRVCRGDRQQGAAEPKASESAEPDSQKHGPDSQQHGKHSVLHDMPLQPIPQQAAMHMTSHPAQRDLPLLRNIPLQPMIQQARISLTPRETAAPRSSEPTPRSLGPTPRSLGPTPRSLGPTPRSLGPTPRSTPTEMSAIFRLSPHAASQMLTSHDIAAPKSVGPTALVIPQLSPG